MTRIATPEKRLARAGIRAATGCLEWTLTLNNQGYGMLRVGTKTRSVHRLSWEQANGPIPDGMCILHRCDNRKCFEPTHLFLGTRKSNMEDCVRKGRNARGETQGHAKLKMSDVVYLRTLPKKEFHRHVEAARLNVRPETLDRIRRGVDWAHI